MNYLHAIGWGIFSLIISMLVISIFLVGNVGKVYKEIIIISVFIGLAVFLITL